MRLRNGIACSILALALLSSCCLAKQHYSYAEVLAGVGFPMDFSAFQNNTTGVNPGPVGTTIVLNSLFPLSETFSVSPSFGFLSTNSKIPKSGGYNPEDPGLDARFQQSELAVDLLVKLRDQNKFRFGPGISGAWWTAAEDIEHRPSDYYYEDNRQIVRGQSFMARGVAHIMLRNPAVSGVSMKLIGAIPLADFLKLDNTSATGYVSLQIGFSMLLN